LKEVDNKFLQYQQTEGKPTQNNNKQIIKPSTFTDKPGIYAKDERFKKLVQTEQKNVTGTSFIASDASSFSEGDTVLHERFGNGIIISIEGQPPNTTATVQFEKEGSKKLLLRFAKLQKL
jgi:DNA helicase-2/ATP-dependent DNA helicase PcrA